MKWGSASTLIEDYTSFFKLERKYSKAFCWLIVFSFLYIFPILIANFYYIDDVGRAITGGISWNRDGRPLLTALIVFLSNGKPIMEISPWMQILAVIVFDYASILFARKYVVSASSLQIFFLTAFGFVNWFLLENVSYKYESLGMLASISIPLILYALPDKVGGGKKQIVFTLFSVMASLSLYQVSIGAYLSLIIIEMLYLLYQKTAWKQVFKWSIMRMIAIAAGSILYKLTIAKHFVPQVGYSADHGHLVGLTAQGLTEVYHHFLTFGLMWKDYFLTLRYAGDDMYCCRNNSLGNYDLEIRERERCTTDRDNSFFLSSPILLALSSVIALLVLQYPIYAPRVMLSFTIFTLYAGLMVYHLSKLYKGVLVAAGIVLVLTLSFSSVYENLLTRQDHINALVATRLANDLDNTEMESGQKIKFVSFIRHSPKCKELLLYEKKSPLLSRLVPIYMNNNWFWGYQYLSHFRMGSVQGLPDKNLNKKEDLSYIKGKKPVRHNEFYELYLQENRAIVLFPESL